MPLYENVFLARQALSVQEVEQLVEQFKACIESLGGSFGKVEYWGLRVLAYKIKKNQKAHYVLINIDAPAAAVAEMERRMRLNEDILRFMTVSVAKHDEEPSVMMQKRDRDKDERRRRDHRGDRPERTERHGHSHGYERTHRSGGGQRSYS